MNHSERHSNRTVTKLKQLPLLFRRTGLTEWIVGLVLLGSNPLITRSQTSPTGVVPPDKAVETIALPEGFQATLFAAEPEVVQPVAMAFDDRGRLWVVEMLTYGDLKTNFDLTYRDRIVILEDHDGDGRSDKRTVFWEANQRVTSIEIGFGGVWVLAAPQMLFIPDKNNDAIPDGPAVVLLDGWDAGPIRHNIVNGLKWGPDGWLYGRHGIQATSNVGKPGASAGERVRLNCCIWRYHPTRHTFEVVCQGGTNAWGHDWDEFGNLWFINTVIGHLWHGIPGAWFKRMYGEHLAPNRYDLIDQHADHYHWDTGKSWTDSRDGAHGADALGGGHAHSGLMIYLGDNWPARFRNELFTLNFHGRRVNHEHLERRGSGYVGLHRPDLITFGDTWFRGVDLAYGPDGGVYVLDWSDRGECHENDSDGVHRETGRVYKITYGTPRPQPFGSLLERSDEELVHLLLHRNEWFARKGSRILQERAASGHDLREVHAALLSHFGKQMEVPRKLRMLWTLHVTAGASEGWLRDLLSDPNEDVRAWAVTLLTEPNEISEVTTSRLRELAQSEGSARVRLAIASAMQRLPLEARPPIAGALLSHSEDAKDHNLPNLIWYGIEPAVSEGLPGARRLYTDARIPKVRQWIARRLGEDLEKAPRDISAMLGWAIASGDAASIRDVLFGLSDALRGWRKAPKPSSWEEFAKQAATQSDAESQDRLRELGIVFGDGRALSEVRKIALSTRAESNARRVAIQQLVEAQVDDLDSLLERLLSDRAVAGAAARGLAQSADAGTRTLVFDRFQSLSNEDQAAVVNQLVTRPGAAAQLLAGVAEGKVARSLINSLHARQMLGHGDESLAKTLAKVWGDIRTADADKQHLITRYRASLTPEHLAKADLSRGRQLFAKTCAGCHRLYGEGKSNGPDLTGSGRNNLEYLLENIVDPNAMVPTDYRVSNIELKDDRSLSGVVVARSDRTIELQTQNERLTIDRSEIAGIQQGTLSLMPEGLAETLSADEFRDLIAYLMHPRQVPLPAKVGLQSE